MISLLVGSPEPEEEPEVGTDRKLAGSFVVAADILKRGWLRNPRTKGRF